MEIAVLVLVLNAVSSWYMVGLIWFVQLVHYPQFAQVGLAGFADYHRRHTRFTTLAVGPAMLVEGVTTVAIVFLHPWYAIGWLAWTGLGLVGLLWLSTAFLQVPRHNRLALGFDADACRDLCRSNWLRTVGWTVRGFMAAWMLAQAIAARPVGGL